jgi:SAM-dependent methyltransferase
MGGDTSLGARQLERLPLDWPDAYLRARELEGRLYPDATVAMLPDVPASDPLAAEWRIRADSAARLVAHLERLPRPLGVLDVGCGNGWLADRIARIEGCRVVGVDANERELAQARRVFGSRRDLDFVLADITLATQRIGDPTVIVLASVAQYVRDLPELLRRLRTWLPPDGELHVLDTPFYASPDLPEAAERSRRHYADLGVPEMAAVYRHHEWRLLAEFAPDVLHRPDSLRARAARRIGRPRSPFPWIRIRALPPRDAGA